MHSEKEKLEEQDHPLKNTDRAFVQVGKDGEPVMPERTEDNDQTEKAGEQKKSTYDRP